ncbi:unnamed protein product [Musa acuminata subsp. malaccensis]|uniref:(wild Malaysian banana) hypothetical protein n=1 Tax=Musa acuminata subsp. malaccensis TaxID=214687 RepID=A0A804K1W8_MUSAM|nr:unnamed protein product [Musa acuminata subsp. malaccensis]
MVDHRSEVTFGYTTRAHSKSLSSSRVHGLGTIPMNCLENMDIKSPSPICLTLLSQGIRGPHTVVSVHVLDRQPPFGTPIQAKDAVICKFPDDPSILLGTLSVVTLVLAAIAGHVAVYFPYKGKSVPRNALFRSATLSTFFVLAEVLTVLALVMLLWTTISESLHRSRNVHRDLTTQCPTAKTGLFGGGAFLALDAALFWLVCQMLTLNARSDYLDEDDTKGEYVDVCTTEFDVAETHLPTA